MKIVTILAGGWSASLLDLKKLPGTVIAVNDAMRYAPRWDIGLSMDRLWHENRLNLILQEKRPIWLRASAVKTPTLRNLIPNGNVKLFECDHASTSLSNAPGMLNGTHSGFCALNLAYQMRPDELYLVGFDMHLGPKGEKHWFPDYTWAKSTGSGRLSEWSNQFDGAAKQLDLAEIHTMLVYQGLGNPYVSAFDVIDRAAMESAPCAA